MFPTRLTKEIEEKAEKELGETAEVRDLGLKQIREWIIQQPFANQTPGDLLLLNYLRGCRFDQAKAREKLSHYFTRRAHVRDIYQSRDPEKAELDDILSRGIISLAMSEDTEMIILRWEHCDVKKVPLINVLKLGFMLFDVFVHESPTFMAVGHTVLIDCQNLPFGYIKQFSPSLLKELEYIMFKAYPTRIKGVHVVNSGTVMGIMVSMFKPFLPENIKSRIKIYANCGTSDILKHIPSHVLPQEYGGRGESIDTLKERTRKILKDRRAWFVNEDNRVIIDQALRGKDVYV